MCVDSTDMRAYDPFSSGSGWSVPVPWQKESPFSRSREARLVREAMDALIRREKELADESAARAAKKSPPSKPQSAADLLVGSQRPQKKKERNNFAADRGPSSSKSAAAAQPQLEDEALDDNDYDDEEDEDLRENGNLMPELLEDPRSAAEADAVVSRRVYVEGMVQRKDLNRGSATVLGWNVKQNRWEIEMDKGDERVLVRSANLGFLDIAPPAMQPSSGKKRRAAEEGSNVELKEKKEKKNPKKTRDLAP